MKTRPFPGSQSPAGIGVVKWRTTVHGAQRVFYVPYAHSLNPTDSTRPAVNLNGIGEGPWSAQVATTLGPNIISPVLPLRAKGLELTPANIVRIASEVPLLIAERALEILDLKNSTVDIVARSQGAAVGVRAVSENTTLYGQLAFIMPFGFNQAELGSTPDERRHELLKRLALSALRSNPFDLGHMRSTSEIASYMIRSGLTGRLFPALDAALSFDMVDELNGNAQGHRTAVFLGNTDPMFPASEIEHKLNPSIEVIHLPGTHATPGSHQGRRQVAAAYQWLRPAA